MTVVKDVLPINVLKDDGFKLLYNSPTYHLVHRFCFSWMKGVTVCSVGSFCFKNTELWGEQSEHERKWPRHKETQPPDVIKVSMATAIKPNRGRRGRDKAAVKCSSTWI